MCCFVRTHVYVCIISVTSGKKVVTEHQMWLAACCSQCMSQCLCVSSLKVFWPWNTIIKFALDSFGGTTRVICTDRQKERGGGGLLHTDKMEEEGAEERARDRWGTKLNGSNTSPLILTNGRVTEWGDCKTHALSVTTTGINSRVSQWQWLESK